MSYACDNCGKSVSFGRTQKHKRGVAGKRWRKRAQSTLRMFKPNLQKVSVLESGKKVAYKLCTNCIKRLRKEKKLYSQTSAALG